MIIPPNMEHQKLTLRGCLGLIVFTLSLLIGIWLVIKFDRCPFIEKGAGIGLENRSTIDSNRDMEFWENTELQRSAMFETKCPDSLAGHLIFRGRLTQPRYVQGSKNSFKDSIWCEITGVDLNRTKRLVNL